MEFKGHFTVSKKENVDFNFLLMKKRLIGMTVAVFFIITASVTLLNYAMYTISVWSALAKGLSMGVLGALVMILFNVGSMHLRINSMYKKNRIQDFTFDVLVDESGFHARSARGDSDVPWDRVRFIQETKNAFYIFITENNANVLPKPQMRLPADAQLLRKIAMQHLDASRCKLQKV